MKKPTYFLLGSIITPVGLLITLSPFPLGIFILGPGLAMMIKGSDKFCRWVAQRRESDDGLNEILHQAQKHMPEDIAAILRRTEPAPWSVSTEP